VADANLQHQYSLCWRHPKELLAPVEGSERASVWHLLVDVAAALRAGQQGEVAAVSSSPSVSATAPRVSGGGSGRKAKMPEKGAAEPGGPSPATPTTFAYSIKDIDEEGLFGYLIGHDEYGAKERAQAALCGHDRPYDPRVTLQLARASSACDRRMRVLMAQPRAAAEPKRRAGARAQRPPRSRRATERATASACRRGLPAPPEALACPWSA